MWKQNFFEVKLFFYYIYLPKHVFPVPECNAQEMDEETKSTDKIMRLTPSAMLQHT